MKSMIEELKNCTVIEPMFSIKSAAKTERMADMEAFKDAVKASLEG